MRTGTATVKARLGYFDAFAFSLGDLHRIGDQVELFASHVEGGVAVNVHVIKLRSAELGTARSFKQPTSRAHARQSFRNYGCQELQKQADSALIFAIQSTRCARVVNPVLTPSQRITCYACEKKIAKKAAAEPAKPAAKAPAKPVKKAAIPTKAKPAVKAKSSKPAKPAAKKPAPKPVKKPASKPAPKQPSQRSSLQRRNLPPKRQNLL